MKLTSSAITRPVAVTVLSIVAALLGAVAVLKMPVDLLPSVEYPRLTIETTYPSSSPYEVERLVTDPLENAVAGVRGLRSYTSRSYGDRSRITLEFDWGARMDFTRLEVREKLDVAGWSLPDEAGRPTIVDYDPSRRPFMEILMTMESGDWTEVTDFARRIVTTRIDQAEGVAGCEIQGEAEPAVFVRLREGAVEELELDPSFVAQALQGANVSMSGGLVRDGQREFFLSLEGEFSTLEDVENTVIGIRGTTPVLLSDVAEVSLGEKPVTEWASFNGDRCLIIRVRKMAEANTVEVAREVEELIGELNNEYQSLSLSIIQNDAEFIEDSIGEVIQALVLGGILAFGVLFFFLRDWRSPLILGLSLPLSIAIALFFLYIFGVTLNIMSLGGLALGTGLLVDNAVVVLEAIYRRRESGEKAMEGADAGTSEVGKAITASTLTTLIVFFPVVYMEGITSQLFKDQALAVGFALLASLLVAVTIIPALTARIRRIKLGTDVTTRFRERYASFLERLLKRPFTILAGTTVVFLLSLVIGLELPMQLLPSTPVDQLELSYSAPMGASMQQIIDLSAEVTGLAAESGAQWVSGRSGVRSEEGVDAVLTASYPSPGEATAAMQPLRNAWNSMFSFPMAVEKRESLLGEILGGGSSFTVYLEGENIEVDRQAAVALAAILSGYEGVESADIQFLPGKPEMVLDLDQELLNLYGLSANDVADFVESLSRGVTATTYYRQDERVDVILLAGRGEGIPMDSLLQRSIPTSNGLLPLSRVARPYRQQTPGYIEHNQGNRSVGISVQGSGSNLARISREVAFAADTLLREVPVQLRQGDEIEEMNRTTASLVLAALLAIGLVYVLLATQFESFREPFVIMFTVPMGIIGVVIALALFGQSWNALSGIGLVVLSGIVVNDGILLVERIGQLRREGMERHDAIIQAGRDRFRPVLMTTVTTVLGLLPMAIGFGSGASLRQPLAIAVIGGITIATALTLVLVPILYKVLSGKKDTVVDG
ncbi:MAG: efflux RND transporter permease subunit [Candidatus Fermentibacteraceae bacterium]|nr:efflux RND transporter permease subunit [Candidatus Fermentibacteraceae bacterium]MBN2608116.1 efflux RND transporter permease subunit [Candidatus Fermentibacteraceae bacterium]